MNQDKRPVGRPKGQAKTGGRVRGSAPKTGGRKKSTPNKSSLTLSDALADIGFSSAQVISDALKEVPPSVQLDFMIKLLPYLHAQRKPIDPEEYVLVEQVMKMQTQCFEALSAVVADKAPQQAQEILDDYRNVLSTYAAAHQNGGHG